MLKPGTPVGRLGLGPTVEVVFHGWVKGEGLNGGAASGDKNTYLPHALVAGRQEHLLQVWAPGYSGVATAVRVSQGGGQGKGGVYQGGVATRMGGLRILGPNGRDQTHTPRR